MCRPPGRQMRAAVRGHARRELQQPKRHLPRGGEARQVQPLRIAPLASEAVLLDGPARARLGFEAGVAWVELGDRVPRMEGDACGLELTLGGFEGEVVRQHVQDELERRISESVSAGSGSTGGGLVSSRVAICAPPVDA